MSTFITSMFASFSDLSKQLVSLDPSQDIVPFFVIGVAIAIFMAFYILARAISYVLKKHVLKRASVFSNTLDNEFVLILDKYIFAVFLLAGFSFSVSCFLSYFAQDLISIISNVSFVIFVFLTAKFLVGVASSIYNFKLNSCNLQNKKNYREATILCDKSLASLSTGISKIIIYFVALGVIASSFGIDLWPFITTAGIVSIMLALAVQRIFSNVFGGLIILFKRPFKYNDYAMVGGVEGRILKIGLLFTEVAPQVNFIGFNASSLNFSLEFSCLYKDKTNAINILNKEIYLKFKKYKI